MGDEADADWQEGLVEWGIDDALNEIADGAWGDGPRMRGLARDRLAERRRRANQQRQD